MRLFPKWAILEVGSILQQCLAWRPIGRLATHHLFLGHCCPTSAQLMAPRPAANAAACTFAPQNCQEILRPFLTRKLCSSAADENSSSGSHIMHSCINFKNGLPFPSLLSPLPTCAAASLPTTTDLFCPLARLVLLLLLLVVTPFSSCCKLTAASLQQRPPPPRRFQRSRRRSGHHVKSPQRVSRNCCLLRPFANAARPTSLELHRPAECWWAQGPRSCSNSNSNIL